MHIPTSPHPSPLTSSENLCFQPVSLHALTSVSPEWPHRTVLSQKPSQAVMCALSYKRNSNSCFQSATPQIPQIPCRVPPNLPIPLKPPCSVTDRCQRSLHYLSLTLSCPHFNRPSNNPSKDVALVLACCISSTVSTPAWPLAAPHALLTAALHYAFECTSSSL